MSLTILLAARSYVPLTLLASLCLLVCIYSSTLDSFWLTFAEAVLLSIFYIIFIHIVITNFLSIFIKSTKLSLANIMYIIYCFLCISLNTICSILCKYFIVISNIEGITDNFNFCISFIIRIIVIFILLYLGLLLMSTDWPTKFEVVMVVMVGNVGMGYYWAHQLTWLIIAFRIVKIIDPDLCLGFHSYHLLFLSWSWHRLDRSCLRKWRHSRDLACVDA